MFVLCFRVSVGTATAQLARPAVIEMAFPSSVIDTSMYYEIVRELHAEYDSNADTYVVDCWLAGSAPEFMLNLATGGVISIPSSDYIAPVSFVSVAVKLRNDLLSRSSFSYRVGTMCVSCCLPIVEEATRRFR